MKLEMTFLEWLSYEMPVNQIVVNASGRDGMDRFQESMIGVGLKCRRGYLTDLPKKTASPDFKTTLYCKSFSLDTDRKRRGDRGPNSQAVRRATIDRTLEANGFKNTSAGASFFDDLLRSKFTFSPEGNGIDCHRHYEALVFKSIPILEKNPLIERKYEGLPILYTVDYSEITVDYLDEVYARFLDGCFDFSKLFMDSYDEKTRFYLKTNGNYWCLKYPERSGFRDEAPWPEIT